MEPENLSDVDTVNEKKPFMIRKKAIRLKTDQVLQTFVTSCSLEKHLRAAKSAIKQKFFATQRSSRSCLKEVQLFLEALFIRGYRPGAGGMKSTLKYDENRKRINE